MKASTKNVLLVISLMVCICWSVADHKNEQTSEYICSSTHYVSNYVTSFYSPKVNSCCKKKPWHFTTTYFQCPSNFKTWWRLFHVLLETVTKCCDAVIPDQKHQSASSFNPELELTGSCHQVAQESSAYINQPSTDDSLSNCCTYNESRFSSPWFWPKIISHVIKIQNSDQMNCS